MIAQSNFDYDARIIRFTTALNEKNIIVDAICLRNSSQARSQVINGGNIFRVMENFNQDSIISYIFHSLVFVLLTLFKTIRISFKNKYDIIHVHNMPDYLVFSALFLKLRGIPIILDIHDLTVELFKEKWNYNKFRVFRSILVLTERLSCRFVTHIITVTKECEQLLIKRGVNPGKITLIMNSADKKDFTFKDPGFIKKNEMFKILYHGTIAYRFGLHNFIAALPEIKASAPQVEFHIYGKGDDVYISELKKIIKGNNLNNNVILKGFIPYHEINNMIKKYDMAAITYEQSDYMNLAMPTKAGEYALAGLPMVISNLKSVRSVFRDNSVIYINSADVKSISNGVIKLIKNVELRTELVKNAYKDVQQISWEIMKVRYLDLVFRLNNSKL